MKKTFFVIIFIFITILSACSSNNAINNGENMRVETIDDISFSVPKNWNKEPSNDSKFTYQPKHYDKDEFYANFSSDVNSIAHDIQHIMDVPLSDRNSTTSAYVITWSDSIKDITSSSPNYHVSITYNNDTNAIERIDTFTENDNYVFFSSLVNMIATNLDETIDVETFTEKYKLLYTENIMENVVLNNEKNFEVFKTVSDTFISVYFSME